MLQLKILRILSRTNHTRTRYHTLKKNIKNIKTNRLRMKKKKLTYGFLIAIMILTSCSSDDNNDNGTDGSIVGTWTGVSSSFNGQNSGVPDNSIVKFTSDNRTEFIYEGFGNNGQDISEFGDWSKSGNTLTITWDDADPGLETYNLTVTELTENSLKWQTEISGEGTLKESFEK